jgi:hypoxanthine phosphoribosyltransferase
MTIDIGFNGSILLKWDLISLPHRGGLFLGGMLCFLSLYVMLHNVDLVINIQAKRRRLACVLRMQWTSILILICHKKIPVLYLDDIVIYSNTLEEHIDHVKKVVDVLREQKFYLNAKKLQLLLPELKVLGRIVDNDGI